MVATTDPNETVFADIPDSTKQSESFPSTLSVTRKCVKNLINNVSDSPQSESGFRNGIEIRLLGQMRSGNHAVIQWIQTLFPGSSFVFLNNIKHGNYDPYSNYTQFEASGMKGQKDLNTIRKVKKDILLYSYEDRKTSEGENADFLHSVFNEGFERNREYYIGCSHRHFDIFVLRDPFNFFASRLMQLRRHALGGQDDLGLIKENWKSVAKRAIEIEANQTSHEIVVNYSKWIVSKAYQQLLSSRLQGHYTVPCFDRISNYGGGSSFPSCTPLTFREVFANKHKISDLQRWMRFDSYIYRFLMSRKKQFLTRWQLLANDEEYRSLFHDPEILELSDHLFGSVAGSRRFVDEVCGHGRTTVSFR